MGTYFCQDISLVLLQKHSMKHIRYHPVDRIILYPKHNTKYHPTYHDPLDTSDICRDIPVSRSTAIPRVHGPSISLAGAS